MKTYRNLAVAGIAILLGSFALTRAETVPPSSNPHSTPSSGATSPDSPSKKRPTRLDTLSEKLSLTAEQKDKVAVILKDEQAAFKQLKKDPNVPEDLKRTKHREIADAHEAQIRAVLTAQQQPLFDQFLEKAHRHDGI